jgi:DNA-binding winged helix-turn-helix (wHTH) protein
MFFKKPKTVPSPTLKYISIGNFKFYPDQNKLINRANEIALSKKECEILEILVSKPNKIIKREDLTKQVWEDNGVFVGRSLDTYISKLRKILQEDKSLKITNIHGVGYKLQIIQ